MLCDHVRNSHDRSVLQSIDITRKDLMLITVRACYTNDITNVSWRSFESFDRTFEILLEYELRSNFVDNS